MAKKNSVAVFIPVYKEEPSASEIKSIKNSIRVLGDRDIFLCHPDDLDLNAYDTMFDAAGKDYRSMAKDPSYFKSILTYNHLMLTRATYKDLRHYEYIFIFQPDAWIFRDELDDWMSLGYDNIGAPWFHEDGSYDGAGNGGFCLRKVRSAIKVLGTLRFVRPLSEARSINMLKERLVLSNLFHEKFLETPFYEDRFFAVVVPKRLKWFKNCPPEIAFRFSFERQAQALYQRNEECLPMGCHAWEKYEPDFWSEHIH